MIYQLMDAVMGLFRRDPAPRGDVCITPYASLYFDDLTEHEESIRKRIAQSLGEYQDRMVQYHRANSPSILRLQLINACWNPDTNEIRVYGAGDRSFAWYGTLEQFLATDMLLEAA